MLQHVTREWEKGKTHVQLRYGRAGGEQAPSCLANIANEGKLPLDVVIVDVYHANSWDPPRKAERDVRCAIYSLIG